MVLTREEEKELLADYHKIAWKIVNRFCSGGHSNGVFDRDDLYQECMIVLIKHMQDAKCKEELRRFQTMDLVNVMTRCVLGSQAVRLDINRTDKAKKTLNSLKGTVCYDDMRVEDLNQENRDTYIDFEMFVDTLPQRQREIILLKGKGYNNTEIAKLQNITPQSVGEFISRAQRAYHRYAA